MPGFDIATPEKAGITSKHLEAIKRACEVHNCFLFIRPSEAATMRLIDLQFATKSMDVHDKSSNWGLTSGFVPIDQAFNKKATRVPDPHVHPHAHGDAVPVHLKLSLQDYNSLKAAGHFGTGFREVGREGAFLVAESAIKPGGTSVEFALHTTSGEVFWREKGKATKVPVWVWGYNGIPVTGDYDMWMACPHVSAVRGEREIHTVKDSHGRSAATAFTTRLIHSLNRFCNRTAKPVFNHGAEAQNLSFTQATDKYFVAFAPGAAKPFLIPRVFMKAALHDLLRHGYVVIRNAKWLHGTTLMAEDMADADEQFPQNPVVQAGVKARGDLQTAAATMLQRKFRENRGMTYTGPKATVTPPGEAAQDAGNYWKTRAGLLRQFRQLARLPDQQDTDLLLGADAFPSSGPGSGRDVEGEASTYSQDLESRFKRTGFVMEDGNVVPVDQTVPKPHAVVQGGVPKPTGSPSFSEKMQLWKKFAGEL